MTDQEKALAVVRSGIGKAVKHIGQPDFRFSLDRFAPDYDVTTPAAQFLVECEQAGVSAGRGS